MDCQKMDFIEIILKGPKKVKFGCFATFAKFFLKWLDFIELFKRLFSSNSPTNFRIFFKIGGNIPWVNITKRFFFRFCKILNLKKKFIFS